jgi:hypothetical protein
MIKITLRRTLGLLALLAGAAGLTQLTSLPPTDDAEPAPPPLALPASSPPAAEPAPVALQDALPAPPPLRRVVQAAPPAVLSIGSEGYGPHIDRAQVSNDAGAAWEAVRWLRQCATNEQRRNSFEKARDQGVSTELMTQLMVEADAEARRCQTVTAQHRARLPELAARAMRAGVPEAASAYAGAVFASDLTPAQRQEVAEAMRRDARDGDPQSLLGAALSHEAWGLSEAERLAFLHAYGEIAGQHGKTVVRSVAEQRMLQFKAPPTPQQWAAAELAGREIVERVRARRP